jgi:Tol biopolymer transport system component
VEGYVGSRVDVSSDDRYVGWWTSSDQAHPGATPGIFRTDVAGGEIVPVASGVGANGVLSRDGLTAAYTADVTEDQRGVYVRALPAGLAVRVDVTPSGAPAPGDAGVEAVSADGHLVLFASDAAGLEAGTTAGTRRLYLRDVSARTTSLVARCSDDGSQGCSAAMTPDAAWVVYEDERTDPGQIYRWQRSTGEARLVSATPGGAAGNGPSWTTSISDDGRLVAFESDATDLLATPVSGHHAYVRDLAAGTTTLVDRTPSGAVANGETDGVYLSGDGSRVAIVSKASNLTSPGVSSRYGQIYVRDLATGATRLVTRTPYGTAGNGFWDTPSDTGSWAPTLSPDGRWLAFASQSTDLVVGGTTTNNVFRADLGS